MAEYPYYPQPEQRRIPAVGILIVVILIAAAGILIFSLLRPAPEVAPVSVIVEKELAAAIIVASSISDALEYLPQPNAAYVQDQPLYLYLEVSNIKQKEDLTIDVTEDIEIKNAEGRTMFAKRNFVTAQEKSSGTIGQLKFRNIIPTTGWTTGNYVASVIINDNIAKQSVSKTVLFSIQQKSPEAFEKITDLTSILSIDVTKTQLIRQQIVRDAQGTIIPDLTYNQTVAGDVAGIDVSKIIASFKMPERFDAGTYSVEIAYLNLENGKSVSVQDTVTVTKQLAIAQFVFAKSIADDYSYVPQPDATFNAGAEVNIYIKLIDFAQPFVNGTYTIKFTEGLQIMDSKGVSLFSQQDHLKVDEKLVSKQDSYDLKNSFITEGLAPGAYTVKIIIKDLNSGQEAIGTEVFKLQ